MHWEIMEQHRLYHTILNEFVNVRLFVVLRLQQPIHDNTVPEKCYLLPCSKNINWNNGYTILYYLQFNTNGLLLFTYLHHFPLFRLRLERDVDGDATLMRIELRHNDVLADEKELESMWSVLLPYLKEVEQLLTHFHGMIFRWFTASYIVARIFMFKYQTTSYLSKICKNYMGLYC